jgi:hypothetical protein
MPCYESCFLAMSARRRAGGEEEVCPLIHNAVQKVYYASGMATTADCMEQTRDSSGG